ncbi:MAG: MGMT family protein [Planctomycetaceae bacterium]|nr:MGMT family protein [Planctomycetaceae bacterium]
MTESNASLIEKMVRRVPRGRVATYGQIAALIGAPRNSRQVGSVLRSLPDDSRVPWHRIVNACGKVSDRGESVCEGLQRHLLEEEGVEFDEHSRVDLKAYQWKPRRR